MTFFEALAAFVVVMTVLFIPISAIITRKSSIIGQAIAERIAKRGRRKNIESESRETEQLRETIAEQAERISQLEDRVSFLDRLIEHSPKE